MASRVFKTAGGNLQIGGSVFTSPVNVIKYPNDILHIEVGSFVVEKHISEFVQENGDPWDDVAELLTYIDTNFSIGGGDGTGVTILESDTLLFNQDYIVGNSSPRTGNISFDFTGAKLGTVTRVLHNSGTKPTLPEGATVLSGDYTISVDNYIWFCITDITEGSEKVEVTVSQSKTW